LLGGIFNMGGSSIANDVLDPRADEIVVIAGLDPAIHRSQEMDARVKPAHDAGEAHSASR
jgi:hypothetical protein